MPFPLGARARSGATRRELVPWAWGINGCASVLAAILATLLAMTFGTRAVVFIAAALYLIAGVAFGRQARSFIGRPVNTGSLRDDGRSPCPRSLST